MRSDTMTTAADALDQRRKAFQEHSWGQAYACLSAADQEASLGSDDLERVEADEHRGEWQTAQRPADSRLSAYVLTIPA
jgi:hypothetical protein